MEKGRGVAVRASITREQMKYFAMLTMAINHISNYWEIAGIPGQLMLGIGYFTGPCMCYFLVEGFYHTRSVASYLKRLLLFGVLSQLPFNMLVSGALLEFEHLNMMFTLALCLVGCMVYESVRFTEAQKKVIYLMILLASGFCDWNYLAPIFVYTILRMRDGSLSRYEGHKWQWIMFLSVLTFQAMDYAKTDAVLYGNGAILRIVLPVVYILCYLTGPCLVTLCIKHRDTGKPATKSKWSKWFFYLFYPVHMLVLIWVKM